MSDFVCKSVNYIELYIGSVIGVLCAYFCLEVYSMYHGTDS